MEQVESFTYFGSMEGPGGGTEIDIPSRVRLDKQMPVRNPWSPLG